MENLSETLGAVAVDCHNHSTLSPDGFDTPLDMAARACGLGIKHFALTDHIEIEQFDDGKWDYWGALDRSYAAYLEIKEKYAGRMNVYYGAELGQPLYDLPLAERILAERDFDFVLGSQHRTKTYPSLNQVPDSDEDRLRCMDEYFEEQLALAQWGRFCSLSHLNFPLRFLCYNGEHYIDMSRYADIIDEILKTIIGKDIAMEVNSSGIRKGLGVSMPGADIVRRYRELGGKMITIGSDAHRSADVGADIPQCIQMLKACGFDEICVFSKKTPMFINI